MPPESVTCIARLFSLGALLPFVPGDMSQAVATEIQVNQARFNVFLDGNPIGVHDFRVNGTTENFEVTGRARFNVRFWHLTVYHYEHSDHERWVSGCLVSLDARTNDNGRLSEVSGGAEGAVFHVQTARGARRLSGCVASYAYWNSKLLARSSLLNAQTGAYEPVTVCDAGPMQITVGQRTVAAKRITIHRMPADIDVWYSQSGEWVALDSRTAEGHLLRYELAN